MPMPFDCSDLAFMLDTETYTLYTLNLLTGIYKPLFKISSNLSTHTLIYNDLDQFLYFYDKQKHKLSQLDREGEVSICTVYNLPEKDYNAITLDTKGQLYLYENNDSTCYVVNLNPNSSDYLTTHSHAITPISINSWCAHPHLPYLYTISNHGQILQLDSHTTDSLTLHTEGLSPLNSYQMLFDYDGLLYIVDTLENIIYRVSLEQQHARCEFFSKLEFAPLRAYFCRSILSPLPISLSTAPAPYTTSLTSNGPRHVYTDLLTFETIKPVLTFPLNDPYYTLTLNVTNHTEHVANLYGWIDWNQNGHFKIDNAIEPILVTPLLHHSQEITLLFKRPDITSIKLGETYIRLRLTTDNLQLKSEASSTIDSRSLGPASDGKILDLPLYIEAQPPVASECLYKRVLTGEILEDYIDAKDFYGDTLIYSIASPPTKGKVNLNETSGYFTYTPNLTPFSQDHFVVTTTSPLTHLSTSTSIQVNIENANLKVEFIPNHTEITLQTPLTYTATLQNTGTLPLERITFKTFLPESMTYQKGSVTINGIQDLISLPTLGISLIKLFPNEICTIAFSVLLQDSLLKESIASCTAECAYSLDDLHNPHTLKVEQLAASCTLKKPTLELCLLANTDSAFLEDLIQYTITLTNTGDLPLTNINLTLALPLEMQYKGDFTYDHTLIRSSNLLEGYLIPYMAPSETHQLQFKASPINSSSTTTLTTIIFTQYTYTLNGLEQTCDELTASHNLTLHQPSFSLTKHTSKTALNLGECFTYTIETKNDSEVPIKEVLLKENVPDFLQVLSIHSGNQPLRNTLESGLSIGNLSPHTSKHIAINLKVSETPSSVKILSYPTVGIFKIMSGSYEKIFYLETMDTDSILLTHANLSLTKQANAQEFVVGETVTYEIIASNTGTLELTHVNIEDLLTPELKFIQGSVKLNHIPLPNASIISGVTLDSLSTGSNQIITFDAIILTQKSDSLESSCSSHYHYLPYNSTKEQIGFAQSNICSIHILNPILEVSGSVNASIAYLHDQLEYTIHIMNTGDMDAYNVMIQNVSCCTSLIDGSFKVNNKIINSVNFGEFINIGLIPKGSTISLTFSVFIIGGTHNENTIINEVSTKFMYYTCDHSTKYITCPTFKLVTPLTPSTFKQVPLEYSLELPHDKPDLNIINTIDGQVHLLKNYIIQTPKGTSIDGQILTGYKLIIHAVLEIIVEYTSADENACVCTAQYNLPFSTFIILPDFISLNTKVHIDATIQNISWRLFNNRCFFCYSSILMLAHLQ